MKKYSSARDEYNGKAEIFLDANESAFPRGDGYHRYPDPLQLSVKQKISHLKGISPDCIFLGNGSDEAIDLLFRIFCNPGDSKCGIISPSYGMYEVSAALNNVEVKWVHLDTHFQLPPAEQILEDIRDCHLLFICNPNNPTGNLLDQNIILSVVKHFAGLVVVDEAYADFTNQTLLPLVPEFDNLVVLRTFSKAYGMAACRLGMAVASPWIIELMNKVKSPYNLSSLVQDYFLKADLREVKRNIAATISERQKLEIALQKLEPVIQVYPSQANFLFVKFGDPDHVCEFLKERGIIVRNRTQQVPGCVRITVGSAQENQYLINTLQEYVE